MPEKYHIKTAATAGRFRHVGKYAAVDYREDCSRCTNCVKVRCIYDTYRKDVAHTRNPETSIQPLYDCRACFSCVQGCTKGLLSLVINPEYLDIGDEYWKPDIVDTTWRQADTGRIPVSGAGYRGRFHGPGFDSIWTDMSEIVRPTRDGIHGREYISTSVDIGPKPMRLSFSGDGSIAGEIAHVIEIQFPALLDLPPWPMASSGLTKARLMAARSLCCLAVVDATSLEAAWLDSVEALELLRFAVPLLSESSTLQRPTWLTRVQLAEINDGAEAASTAQALMLEHPALIVALRMPMRSDCLERIIRQTKAGIKVFHLVADLHGCEPGVRGARHIRDVMRLLHSGLVTAGLRDEVTLIVGGGIALAEHMAKAIICGADLVSLDATLLVALGCRVCHQDHDHANPQNHCPAEIDSSDPDYAAQRIVNLLGAWHSQLIEVLGAMGIREVRRLRGEVGRAIFVEDIEREAFSDLARKSQ